MPAKAAPNADARNVPEPPRGPPAPLPRGPPSATDSLAARPGALAFCPQPGPTAPALEQGAACMSNRCRSPAFGSALRLSGSGCLPEAEPPGLPAPAAALAEVPPPPAALDPPAGAAPEAGGQLPVGSAAAAGDGAALPLRSTDRAAARRRGAAALLLAAAAATAASTPPEGRT